VSDNSLLVDYEAHSAGKKTECFLDPIGLSRRTVPIAEQDEREMMLLSEISMGVLAVGAYSNNFCAEILERLV
jgi:hypothetical protein